MPTTQLHLAHGLVGNRKEKTTPFGVNLMRSQVLYRAAQVMDLCVAGLVEMKQTPTGLCYCQPMPRLHDCKETYECDTAAPLMLRVCGQSVLGFDYL